MIALGSAVIVTHDQGAERGIVVAMTNPRPGEPRTYRVRFADRTESTWPESRITFDRRADVYRIDAGR